MTDGAPGSDGYPDSRIFVVAKYSTAATGTQHSGSRDVTEGVTGGLGTEVGGSRNLRQGTGHTGGDIGNRPE